MEKKEENPLLFTFILFLIILDSFISLKDIITKYILEYNYINKRIKLSIFDKSRIYSIEKSRYMRKKTFKFL